MHSIFSHTGDTGSTSATRLQFMLHQQQRLARRMLAAWPRRGHNLLHLRCGAGELLECLWECGFEVSGYEPDAGLRAQADRLRPPCVDVGGGAADRLPYDDDAFDYVVLSLSGGDDSAALAEAWRVASRGMLLLGWNACSLRWLTAGWPWLDDAALPRPPAGRWWKSWRQVKALQPACHSTLRTTLLLPARCWAAPVWHMLNGIITPLPIGAFAALRLDFGPRPASPSLPLRLMEQFRAPDAATAMEHGAHRQSPRTV